MRAIIKINKLCTIYVRERNQRVQITVWNSERKVLAYDSGWFFMPTENYCCILLNNKQTFKYVKLVLIVNVVSSKMSFFIAICVFFNYSSMLFHHCSRYCSDECR